MRRLCLLLASASAFAATNFIVQPGYQTGCVKVANPDHYHFYGDNPVCPIPDYRPPGNFTPPDHGGSYIDPTFGNRVTIVRPYPEHRNGVITTYSTPSALSATGKYIFTVSEGGFSDITEVATGKVIRRIRGTQDWGLWWASGSDEVFYVVRGTKIVRTQIGVWSEIPVLDVTGTLKEIFVGGTGDPSRDHWIGYWSRTDGIFCVSPMDGSNRMYCASSLPFGAPSAIDFMLMTKGIDVVTGKRYVVIEPWGHVFYVDLAAGDLKFDYTAPEHPHAYRWSSKNNRDGVCQAGESCIGGDWDHAATVDIAGRQFIFFAMPWDGDFNGEGYPAWTINSEAYWLGAGAEKILVNLDQGGGRWKLYTQHITGDGHGATAKHFDCARNAPVCLGSIPNGVVRKDPSDVTPEPDGRYVGELHAVHFRSLGEADVHRVVQHRSVQYNASGLPSYYDLPRGSISGDGRFACATSNFGWPEAHNRRVIVASVPLATAAPDPTTRILSAVNAAGYFIGLLAPGSISAIFGQNLAVATTAAAAVPLPASLAGSSVEVDGVASPLFFVSPEQINFQVPAELDPGPNGRLARVTVRTNQGVSDPYLFWLAAGAPGIFTWDGSRAVANNSDYSVNGPGRAAAAGTALVVYLTGVGAVDGSVASGVSNPADRPYNATLKVSAMIGGLDAQVRFAGLTPLFVGLAQVNLLVPPGVSGTVPVQVTVNGVRSNVAQVSVGAN